MLSPQRSHSSRLLVSVGAIFIALLFLSQVAPHFFSPVALGVARPFWRLPIGEAWHYLVVSPADKTDQEAYISFLEKRISKLSALDNPDQDRSRHTVYVKPPVSAYGTLIIDRGTTDIKQGNIVRTEGEVALGTVERVYAKTALVELFSAPGRITNVLVGGTLPAEAEGVGVGNFRIKLPKGVDVAIGTPVELSGSGKFIGLVGAISPLDDSFEHLYVQVPVNLNTVNYIYVSS
jgi:hypothetical protein